MRNWVSTCASLFLPGIFLIISTGAQGPIAREFQIKAVFLFNFTQFVEWPPDAFDGTESPLVIGILGSDPFGPYIDEAVRGEKIGNHPLVVRRYSSVNEIKDCHILFVSPDNKQQVRQVLNAVKSRSILTVSDIDGFARMGGMIHFFNEDGRIRLRVNVEPVSDARLVISSKLLRLAEIVPSNNN